MRPVSIVLRGYLIPTAPIFPSTPVNLILQGLHDLDHRLLSHARTKVYVKRDMASGGALGGPDLAYVPVDAVASLMGMTTDGPGGEIGMVGRAAMLFL